MTTLVPRGYGGFPSFQFSPPNQINNRYYNDRYRRQGTYFAPHYPTQPLYQPPFNRAEGYPAPAVNQFRPPGLGTQLVMLFNELDEQYRQEQYLRKLQKIQRQYWKLQANSMPPPMYPAPVPLNYSPGTVYQYEKETEYIPFPVFIGPGAGGYGAGRNIGYGGGGNFGYGPGPNLTLGAGGGMSLPPKIRVIFIPTGQSFSQQPYTGSLAMPPFLYNRMSQPLCSFPLPPPLPQLGSLPLTPAVQQMVMQRYSNPIAVLPYTPNWQMPQLMMSGYPSVPQQQQQYMPPISAIPALPPPPQIYIPPSAPTAALPSLPPAPQAFIPPPVLFSAPTSALPSLPPAPQAFIPPPPPSFAPISALPSFPFASQTFIPPPAPSSAPISALPSFPLASQTYIPPTIPANLPVPSSLSLQLPIPDANIVPSLPQYSYSGYPSICRACPPAPPPLNISVTGHCWVQHCSACHHVPTPISNPNVRPGSGRITPLLRHPTVPQYIPEQIRQEQQEYLYANAPVMMRPWLRKTPPLPPGAIVISDEYFNKDGSHSQYNHSQRRHRPYERNARTKNRSTTVTSKTIAASNPTATKNHRSVSPRRANNNNNNNSRQHQGSSKRKSAMSVTSTSTSSSGLSDEYEKVALPLPKTKQDAIPQQLNREARNVHLQYNYQTQELPTVYLINRYLKSSSEASTLSSNVEIPSDHCPTLMKKHTSISSSSSDSSSIKNLPNLKKEDEKPPRPPSRRKKSKEKLIIIREFMTNSPSTISTISSNMTFNILNKDDDSTSTTSSLTTDRLEEDDVFRRDIF